MSIMTTEMETAAHRLKEKISTKTAKSGIVGLGYVGLPLAVELGKAGFPVTGIDLDESKIARINSGSSYILDVPTADLALLVEARTLRATTDFSIIQELDTIISAYRRLSAKLKIRI